MSYERQEQLSIILVHWSKLFSICSRAVQSLPEEQLNFAINAAVDVLQHKVNLYLWKKRKDSLYHENQTVLIA